MTIATAVRAKQKQLKLSTFALAKKLKISYVSVKKVLAGASRPNRATLGKYASFLQVKPIELAERLLGRAAAPKRKAKVKAKRKGKAKSKRAGRTTAKAKPTAAARSSTKRGKGRGKAARRAAPRRAAAGGAAAQPSA